LSVASSTGAGSTFNGMVPVGHVIGIVEVLALKSTLCFIYIVTEKYLY
jgi:hypothetical protein